MMKLFVINSAEPAAELLRRTGTAKFFFKLYNYASARWYSISTIFLQPDPFHILDICLLCL